MTDLIDARSVETDEQRAERILQWKLQRALQEAPEIFAHARALAVSGATERGDVIPRAHSPIRITTEDDIDTRYARLSEWVDNFSEDLNIPAPVARVIARRHENQDVQGFRAHVAPEGASALVSILTMWLNIHHEEISAHSAYSVYREDVVDFLGDLRGRYPVDRAPEKGVLPRPCPVCGAPAVRAEWWSENVHDVRVACEMCEYEIPREDYARILRWVLE